MIKRVVSITQTDVAILNESGTLVVNGTVRGGEIIFPTYTKEWFVYPIRVGGQQLYRLGDHRMRSFDSRDFGPATVEQVERKVLRAFSDEVFRPINLYNEKKYKNQLIKIYQSHY